MEFRAALDVEPTLASASYNLGLALESKGRHAEALMTWESFLEQTVSRARSDEWTKKIRDGLTRLKTAYHPSVPPFPTVMTSTR